MTSPTLSHFAGNRYRLLDSLGSGGMGAVYRAYDRLTGETIALKRLITTAMPAAPDPAVRLALAHEFRALASLRHPNVIAVRDYGFDPGNDRGRQPYFTMELLPLARTIVATGELLPAAAKVHLLLQLLHALSYIHRRQIIHRDIKPGNVLVAGQQLRLLDFGLAAIGEQMEGPTSGTLLYMAPELLLGRPATVASDLYAVGVLAYELFAGWHPFGQAGSNVVQAILQQPPDWSFVEVEPDLQYVLERLLAKTAAERYRDSAEVIIALSTATGQSLPVETAATRESFLQAAPFIGRANELSQLSQSLAEASQGQGSAWLIGGESGIGKSRLLQELRTQALVAGVLVLRGQATAEAGAAYHPWRESLRHLALLAEADDLEAAVLHPLIPDLAGLRGRPVPPAPPLEAKAAQARLLITLSHLLQRAATLQPLLFLLEDMHWADENSLELLNRFNRLAAELPILLIATYRPGERPELPQMLTTMRPLPLRRLAPDQLTALSEAMLGPGGRQPHLVTFLERETEGNTFFVIEVMRALAEEAGRLEWVTQMALPATVSAGGIHQVVQRRLQRILPVHRPLLELAAVNGRTLDLALLHYLAPQTDLEQWLTDQANAAVLERQDGGFSWQFSHDKLREGLLAELAPSQRQAYHRQIGTAVEQVYPADLPPHYADLAYHYGRAGQTELERTYAHLAGDYAAGRFAHTQALAHFGRALELTPLTDAAGRYSLLLASEKVYDVQGNRETQRQILDQLQSLAESLADTPRQVEIALRQANFAEALSNYPAVIEAVQRIITLAHAAGLVHGEADAYRHWGRALVWQAKYEEAKVQLEHSLALARHHNLAGVEADCLAAIGLAIWYLGNHATARTYLEEALGLYRQQGNQRSENSVLLNLGVQAQSQGDLAGLTDYSLQSLRLSQQMGDPQGESRAVIGLGNGAWMQGRHKEAYDYYEQGLRLAHEIDDRRLESRALTNLGAVLYEQGDDSQAQAHFEQALLIYREIGDRRSETIALANLGEVAMGYGDYTNAQTYLENAVALCREIGNRWSECHSLAGLGLLFHQMGDNQTAEQFSRHALETALSLGAKHEQALSWTNLAHSLVAQGHLTEAAEAYQQSITVRQTLGEQSRVIESVAGLARIAHQTGDLPAALTHVETILTHLETSTLAGADEPFRIYLTCYQVLHELADSRAPQLLSTATAALHHRAASISNPTQRHSFLESVPAHRQLLHL